MLKKMSPRITLISVGTVAVLALSIFFIAPERVQRDVTEEREPGADYMIRALMNPGDTAVSPVVKKGTQWFGLCPAYAATTVAGFKAQVMSDPQLMEHYAHFDWGRALIFENQEDSYSSVLYKKNDKVFWTRKLLRIRKGERILTDGRVLIRTYCCNQIALVPPGPFLPPPDEPPPEELQPPEAPAIPDFPPIDVPLIPPALASPPSQPPRLAPPTRLFVSERPSRRPTPIPEPGTFILLVSGLGALALLRRLRRV